MLLQKLSAEIREHKKFYLKLLLAPVLILVGIAVIALLLIYGAYVAIDFMINDL